MGAAGLWRAIVPRLPAASSEHLRIITPTLSGGSKKTAELAEKHGKPWIHLPGRNCEPVSLLVAFSAENGIRTLNIAGARASKEPGIYRLVKRDTRRRFLSGGR